MVVEELLLAKTQGLLLVVDQILAKWTPRGGWIGDPVKIKTKQHKLDL
jgi:hypothetical protein